MEELNKDEKGIYTMLDTLTKTKAFNRLYDIATIAQSGYVEMNGWDYGPIYSTFGFNDVEGMRLRFGGRTYFGQNDLWRIEGYGAYGFKDDKLKYGISGKVLLDPKSRLIISGEPKGCGATWYEFDQFNRCSWSKPRFFVPHQCRRKR